MEHATCSHSKTRQLTDFIFLDGDHQCECCGRSILCLTLLTRRLRMHRPLPSSRSRIRFADIYTLVLLPLAAIVIATMDVGGGNKSYPTGLAGLVSYILISLFRFALAALSYGTVVAPLCVWIAVDGVPLGQTEFLLEAIVWSLVMYMVLPTKLVASVLGAMLFSMWVWTLWRRSVVGKAALGLELYLKATEGATESKEPKNTEAGDIPFDRRPLLSFLSEEPQSAKNLIDEESSQANGTKPPRTMQAAYRKSIGVRNATVLNDIVADDQRTSGRDPSLQVTQASFETELSGKLFLAAPPLLISLAMPAAFCFMLWTTGHLFPGVGATIADGDGITTNFIPTGSRLIGMFNAAALVLSVLWLNSVSMPREFSFDYKSPKAAANATDTQPKKLFSRVFHKIKALLTSANENLLQPWLLDARHGGFMLSPLHTPIRLTMLVRVIGQGFLQGTGLMLLMLDAGYTSARIPAIKAKAAIITKSCNWKTEQESISGTSGKSGPKSNFVPDPAVLNIDKRNALYAECYPLMCNDSMLEYAPYLGLVILVILLLFVFERLLGAPIVLLIVVFWCNARACYATFEHFHELTILSEGFDDISEVGGSEAATDNAASGNSNESQKASKVHKDTEATPSRPKPKVSASRRPAKNKPTRKVFGATQAEADPSEASTEQAPDPVIPVASGGTSAVFGDYELFHAALSRAHARAPPATQSGQLRGELEKLGWRPPSAGNADTKNETSEPKGTDWQVFRLRLNDVEVAERLASLLAASLTLGTSASKRGLFSGLRSSLKSSYVSLEEFMNTWVVGKVANGLEFSDKMAQKIISFGYPQSDRAAQHCLLPTNSAKTGLSKAIVAACFALVGEAALLCTITYLFSEGRTADKSSNPTSISGKAPSIDELIRTATVVGGDTPSAQRRQKGSNSQTSQDLAEVFSAVAADQDTPPTIVAEFISPAFNPQWWARLARLLFVFVLASYLSNHKFTMARCLIVVALFSFFDSMVISGDYTIKARTVSTSTANIIPGIRFDTILPTFAVFLEALAHFHCTLTLLCEVVALIICNGKRGIYYSKPLKEGVDFMLLPSPSNGSTILVQPRYSAFSAFLKKYAPATVSSLFPASYPTELDVFEAIVQDDFHYVMGGLLGADVQRRKALFGGEGTSQAAADSSPQKRPHNRFKRR